jgi:hypothetical protein
MSQMSFQRSRSDLHLFVLRVLDTALQIYFEKINRSKMYIQRRQCRWEWDLYIQTL